MYFGGSVISSVDFHGRIALAIFLSQCPLRCPYCQNGELLEDKSEKSLEEVFKLIDDSFDFIDAVVISGGEPLVQSKDVLEILKYTKKLNLETKLDTSGVYPEKLEPLLDWIDYLALDIKAPFDRYNEIIGSDVGSDVKKSMEMAYNKEGLQLECRTTYVPKLMSLVDLEAISKIVQCDIFTLQQFRNRNVLDQSLSKINSPNPIDMREFAEFIKKYNLPDIEVQLKTAEFGDEIIE